MKQTQTVSLPQQKTTVLAPLNRWIAKNQKNEIGISILFMMLGTGVASITTALASFPGVSIPIMSLSIVLALSTNAAFISRQPFKIIVWTFIPNILINLFLLWYQLVDLL